MTERPSYLGCHYSAVPPPDMAPPVEKYREIFQMQDGGSFRPLWVTSVWRLPGGRIVKVTCQSLGHYIQSPHFKRRPVRNLVLPTCPLYGVEWRNPIYEDDLLDGLTDKEREAGAMPRPQQIDARVINGMRFMQYLRANVEPEERSRRTREFQIAQEEAVWRELNEEKTYARRHDQRRLKAALEADSNANPDSPIVPLSTVNRVTT